MKPRKLETMTVDELADRFADIGIAQDQADVKDEIAKFNRLFDEINAVDMELRTRGK